MTDSINKHREEARESIQDILAEYGHSTGDTVRGLLKLFVSRDQEVREVLERLQALPSSKPPCWCRVKWEDGKHDGACLAARELWEKVQG